MHTVRGVPPDARRRLFFALWPDERTRSALLRYRRQPDAGGRPVPSDHLHLTLAFAGTVSQAQAQHLHQMAAEVRAFAFALQLDWIDHFREARVQWLGPRRVPDALPHLASALCALCREAGVDLSEAPFRPHVTLQRHICRPLCGPVAPAPFWQVEDFVLVESGAHGKPGPYRIVARWPLC
ncbi:RNA 2',3'-cyclic phosphodiesterase [Algiphilus sp.]|uniref:RNA 2',3'-cyclic phosphodiesterase n=1 Tax=Algiphilus sp. TaxID=1872431 RepID=UPI003B5174ED